MAALRAVSSILAMAATLVQTGGRGVALEVHRSNRRATPTTSGRAQTRLPGVARWATGPRGPC